ncbi:MAG: hypothetical protein MJA83_18110 [Gammaproteobacteria bacterium]|nr:hypothetical protein [Gammaproteobacteria bacterium]
MGHHISALVARAPIDLNAAKQLDLPVLPAGEFAIVALDPAHADFWAEKFAVEDQHFSDMTFDSKVIHEFANRLGMDRFVLLQTDYFGGVGDQWATVYRGAQRVMEVTKGGINEALALVGVVREGNSDEFDTIGLGAHRDFSDLFEKYWDS